VKLYLANTSYIGELVECHRPFLHHVLQRVVSENMVSRPILSFSQLFPELPQ
ncbi:hypothetical protein EVA_22402, partial [gut metagenome]